MRSINRTEGTLVFQLASNIIDYAVQTCSYGRAIADFVKKVQSSLKQYHDCVKTHFARPGGTFSNWHHLK